MDEKDDKKGDRKIEIVRFDGDELQAVADPGGEVWVVLQSGCAPLGLDTSSQRKRLKRTSWARTVIMTAPDARGHRQELFCLHLKSFPLWLATVDEGRVKPEVREKLVRYQLKAADALAEHFMGARPAAFAQGASERMFERAMAFVEAERAEYRAERLEDRRMMAALIARVESATRDNIGREKAALVNGALTEWAKAHAKAKGQPDDWSRFRRAEENEIRKKLEFSGPGTPWGKYSRADWPRLEREVVRLRTETERLSPQTVLNLVS